METKKKEIEAYKARCDKMTNDELKQEIIKLEKEKKEIKNNIATKTARIKLLELEIKNAKKAEPVEKPVNKVEKKAEPVEKPVNKVEKKAEPVEKPVNKVEKKASKPPVKKAEKKKPVKVIKKKKPVKKAEKKKPVKIIKSKAKTPSKSDDLDGLDLDDLDS